MFGDPFSFFCCLATLAAIGWFVYAIVHGYKQGKFGPLKSRFQPSPPGGPQPGERWWTDFPHQEDPSRSKARPCLVLGYSGRGYWVVKCTTQAPREAHWRVRVTAGWWSPTADKDGYVDLQPFHLPQAFLKRKQGFLSSGEMYRHITSRLRWDRAHDFIR